MIQGRNPGIQWMRALAALLVVVDHCLYTLVDKAGGDAGLTPLATFLGGAGVALFFLVSGCVMMLSATRRFGPAASGDFVLRRLIRVVPLYWLTTLVYAAKLRATGELSGGGDLLRSLLFIPHLDAHGAVMPVYGLGWTLNYEMLFYAIFAVGLLGSLRTTTLFAATSIAALAAVGSTLAGPGDGGASVMAFFWTRPILLYFLAGMALPWIARRLIASGSVATLRAWQAAIGSCALVSLALAAGWWTGWPMAVQLPVLAACVIVAALTLNDAGDHPLVRLTTKLGDASYSIYLTHSFVIGPLARLWAKAGLHSTIGFIAVSLIICAAVGILCFRLVETPLLRWMSPRRRSPSMVAA